MNKVLKRDSRVVDFDIQKIINAISNAFIEVDKEITQETQNKINNIANAIKKKIENNNVVSVEQIQDMVEEKLMASNRKDVAKKYILYREKRRLARPNTTDKDIDELFEGSSEYWNTENSNKDATNITVQRDYIAGITSTDVTKRVLLPQDIVDAHNNGIIHFHKKIVA